VFADPDGLDIARANSRQHLAFGFGPRFCLGASLSRVEMRAALTTLSQRFPDMELATDDLTFVGPGVVRRLAELPVKLGIEHRRGD
jgi:pentalenolactone synthase